MRSVRQVAPARLTGVGIYDFSSCLLFGSGSFCVAHIAFRIGGCAPRTDGRFSEESSEKVARRLLEEARVITIPGGSFGLGGEGHLRISFGGDEDELNEAFDRIKAGAGRKPG